MGRLLPKEQPKIIIEEIIREAFKKKGVDENVFRTRNKKDGN